MLMHQGLGLDHFNQLSESRAVHALFECCCSVVWSRKVVDARPYESYDALFARADHELSLLSEADITDALQCHRDLDPGSEEIRKHLAERNRAGIGEMLGPEDGYPEY